MANLLPKDKRKKIERERWVRMTTTGLVFVLVLVVLSGISLTPSLLLSHSKGENTEKQLLLLQEFIKLQEESGIAKEVRNTKIQLSNLKRELNELNATQAITNLVEEIPSGILLESIRLERENDQSSRLVLSGYATTRDALLSFTRSLEREPMFTEVDLPVSNLAKNSDIDFLFTTKVTRIEI